MPTVLDIKSRRVSLGSNGQKRTTNRFVFIPREDLRFSTPRGSTGEASATSGSPNCLFGTPRSHGPQLHAFRGISASHPGSLPGPIEPCRSMDRGSSGQASRSSMLLFGLETELGCCVRFNSALSSTVGDVSRVRSRSRGGRGAGDSIDEIRQWMDSRIGRVQS